MLLYVILAVVLLVVLVPVFLSLGAGLPSKQPNDNTPQHGRITRRPSRSLDIIRNRRDGCASCPPIAQGMYAAVR